MTEQESNLDFYATEGDEYELPKSVFLLPSDATADKIQLIASLCNFAELDEEGHNYVLSDYIYYDGEEKEADNYRNWDRILKIEYDGYEYDDNSIIYLECGAPGKVIHLYRF